ncbi:hypothetical protein QTI51_37295 [Variovorax sp. J22G73]|uniref:hypothetical protein n=1 Tax=unclassified Variovorax TaxID=663243 RepID=UPI002577B8A3|nr:MULTISPECIES: hypothetical protein [unclassified Variovorax]MDM0010156.1 hypothetical protein [Variovorax sp. J22R203]MDM0102982.1 hypothetical protein [Variovorax sp. J22G73]
MTPHIDAQEREIKELLQRVMREPLQPLSEGLDKTTSRLESLEQQVDDLRTGTIAALMAQVSKVDRAIGDLRRSSNDLADELTDTLIPSLDRGLDNLQNTIKLGAEPLGLALRTSESRIGEALAKLDDLSRRAGSQETLSRELSSSSAAQMRKAAVAVTDQMRSTQQDLLRAIEEASQRVVEDARAFGEQRHLELLRVVDEKLDRLRRLSWLVASVAGLAALGCLGLWIRQFH